MPDIDIVTPIHPAPALPLRARLTPLLMPHRLVMAGLALAALLAIITQMEWSWLPVYLPKIGKIGRAHV
uniref:hypothetical protein n=1 Tax=Salipiger bermudensis TaxID=344736 RepID=UPI00355A4733